MRTKLLYGFGGVSYGVKDQGFSYFLLFYYSQVLGMSASMVSLAIFVALLFDAVSDPIVGYLSDNLHSRWGRRHPFLYASAVPIAVGYYLLWNPPSDVSDDHLFFYLLGFAVLVRLCITFFEVPSTAICAELTSDYDERTSLFSFRHFFGWCGGVAMAVLAYAFLLRPTASYPVGQLNPAGYGDYGIMGGATILLSIVVSSVAVHRFIPQLKKAPPKKPYTLARTFHELKETLSNRSFLALFTAGIFFAIATGISTTLNIYLNTYFWGLESGQILVLGLSCFVAAPAALVFAPRMSRWMGKRRAAMFVSAMTAVFVLSPIVLRLIGLMPANGDPWLLRILFCFTAANIVFLISTSILITSMVADVAEDSELKTTRRSEGVFFAADGFIRKSVHGLGKVAAATMLTVIHFPTATDPGVIDQNIIDSLGLMYVPAVVIAYAAAVAFLSAYKIDRQKHLANLNKLSSRGAAR